ncbi:MAG: imidazole glycerol phosphate synthase subunit HisH [Candidatus Hydrogenedentes bacterium]|nr:imidazole glycerol phosphate synthase subunit HisH [Candidatus Hydrogenedentota bacterium]
MGNLRSVQKAFERVGHEAIVTDDPDVIARADAVVLPGVGAFKDCIDGLRDRGLIPSVKAAATDGRPFLGICVGLQLLFDYSEEGVGAAGLGIFAGRVVRFPDAAESRLKVPHMGWNRIYPANTPEAKEILSQTTETPYTYFVHSYYAVPEDPDIVLARCDHGVSFPAIVGRGNVFATQFHPEKSQQEGLAILKAFGNKVSDAAGVA